MAIERPISDEAHRGLTLLTLTSRGVYAFIDPDLVETMAGFGWCTPAGEITRAGEDAFIEIQRARALKGDGEGSSVDGQPVRRNPTPPRVSP